MSDNRTGFWNFLTNLVNGYRASNYLAGYDRTQAVNEIMDMQIRRKLLRGELEVKVKKD